MNLSPSRPRQGGFALVVSMIFLVLLTLLGIRAMSTSALDERMAAASQHHATAFQGAEAGLTLVLEHAASVPARLDAGPEAFSWQLANGTLCDSGDDACTERESRANSTSIHATVSWRAESRLPPTGYSLDGPFASHHFTITSDAKYGEATVFLEQGFRRLGPRASP